MLTFHPLSLEDKSWIDQHVFAFGSRSADFNFGSMFLWDERYHQQVCDYGGRLVALACAQGTPIFPFPVGSGPLAPVMEAMGRWAKEQRVPFVIRGVERAGREQLEALFPGKFRFSEDREYADYIYEAEKLASLSGKKLHAKRNFINRFTAAHDWHFEALAPQHFEECRSLMARWNDGDDSTEVQSERRAIDRALEHFEALGLLGGALFAEDKLIAFCIGERIADDTVDIHFEKADADIPGAYAMINREYVRLVQARWPEVVYINREDDMGLENLRQAKLSYRPAFLVEKWTAHWVDDDE